jgi:prepilin-type N-terminal cleavage/methylation domain-containing protein
MASKPRSGFSLIEMLIATAIVLVAVGVLSELASVGQRHARAAEDAATAQRICQNRLEEILCGSAPLDATADAIVTEDPEWTCSVELKPLEQYAWEPGIAELRVTVAKASESTAPSRTFSLVRWVRRASAGKGQDKPDAGTGTNAGADSDIDGASALRSERTPPARGPAGGLRP